MDIDTNSETRTMTRPPETEVYTTCASQTTDGAESPSDPHPGDSIGSYRLMRVIDAGGYGTVYEAEHATSGVKAAIKLLRARRADSSSAVARFSREVRALQSLSHPNIVAVEEVGMLPDERPYYVMEFLDGPTLHELLEEQNRLTPDQALTVLEPVCAALAAAHRAGYVHRDVKADNIGTTTMAGERVIKLLDFGVAKLLQPTDDDPRLTDVGVAVGTPLVMAPEQIRSQPVGPATDIYGLGVLLFRMLTGRYPFSASTPCEVERMHMLAPPPRPSEVVAVSTALDAVVLRALEKRPQDRFASVNAFIDALRHAAAAPRSHRPDRSVTASALYLEWVPHDRNPGPQVLDNIATCLDEALDVLEDAGMRILLSTETALLVVQLPQPCRGPASRTRSAVIALARRLHRQFEDRVGDCARCTAFVHTDEAVVRMSADGPILIGGAIAQLGAWLPKNPSSGLFILNEYPTPDYSRRR